MLTLLYILDYICKLLTEEYLWGAILYIRLVGYFYLILQQFWGLT